MHVIRSSPLPRRPSDPQRPSSMKPQSAKAALQVFFALLTGPAFAGTITCTPARGGAGPASWIRRIAIDDHSRTVNMDVVRHRTKDTETMGKIRADLLGIEETQGGEPAYVFNAASGGGDEITHLFRLHKAGEWRLASAGVVFVGKVPTLRTIEPGRVFDCKRSELG